MPKTLIPPGNLVKRAFLMPQYCNDEKRNFDGSLAILDSKVASSKKNSATNSLLISRFIPSRAHK